MIGFLVLGLFFAAMIALIVWALKYNKKVNARKEGLYKAFAEKHGLQHSSRKQQMALLNTCQGQIDGLNVTIYEQIVGSGKNKTVNSHILIENNPFNYQFKIGKEHIFSKAGKMMGLKDIEFGDEAFDKKFLMKSKDEEAFRRMMNMNMQARLKELEGDLVSAIRNDNGKMSYYTFGPLPKEKQFQKFENVFNFMIELTKQRM